MQHSYSSPQQASTTSALHAKKHQPNISPVVFSRGFEYLRMSGRYRGNFGAARDHDISTARIHSRFQISNIAASVSCCAVIICNLSAASCFSTESDQRTQCVYSSRLTWSHTSIFWKERLHRLSSQCGLGRTPPPTGEDLHNPRPYLWTTCELFRNRSKNCRPVVQSSTSRASYQREYSKLNKISLKNATAGLAAAWNIHIGGSGEFFMGWGELQKYGWINHWMTNIWGESQKYGVLVSACRCWVMLGDPLRRRPLQAGRDEIS